MRVVFYDDPESDDDVWETNLPEIPRKGEMVVLPGNRIGRVITVQWSFENKDAPFVEITVTLM
jgi:hypothetical protein